MSHNVVKGTRIRAECTSRHANPYAVTLQRSRYGSYLGEVPAEFLAWDEGWMSG